MNHTDTIAAISSAVGPAARMILRASGSRAREVVSGVAGPIERGAQISRLWNGIAAWVYAFVAPRSYTGDDLIELHFPGSPALAKLILDRIIAAGARLAEPGEFTARAYFNGRMDLAQAEGVAATIGAHSLRELRAAQQLLAGELARRLSPIMDDLAQVLALVEVGIDFTDEDVTFISADDLRSRCAAAVTALSKILDESARFERIRHEPRIVLAGRPNAGKSTLLNTLAGRQRAVVSDIAGTTRDAIWAEVPLRRGMVRIVDVAGIDLTATSNTIDRQMREQALREMKEADVLVRITDGGDAIDLPRDADLVVQTKIDIRAGKNVCPTDVCASAQTGDGMESLRERLDTLAFGEERGESSLALNARHVRAIEEARAAVTRAADSIRAGAEVVALELRESLDHVGAVLGKLSPDDVLGRVFAAFCIGK